MQHKLQNIESVIESYNGEYKRVPFNPDYIAFDDGRVFSVKSSKFITTSPHSSGYVWLNTKLKTDQFGPKKQLLIHQVMAMTFLPNPLLLKEVNHINGCKTDNRVCNLEWSNRQHNMNHAAMTGCFEKSTKLTIEQVKSIRNLRQTTNLSLRKIAQLFNVSRGSIDGIIYNRSFKYVR